MKGRYRVAGRCSVVDRCGVGWVGTDEDGMDGVGVPSGEERELWRNSLEKWNCGESWTPASAPATSLAKPLLKFASRVCVQPPLRPSPRQSVFRHRRLSASPIAPNQFSSSFWSDSLYSWRSTLACCQSLGETYWAEQTHKWNVCPRRPRETSTNLDLQGVDVSRTFVQVLVSSWLITTGQRTYDAVRAVQTWTQHTEIENAGWSNRPSFGQADLAMPTSIVDLLPLSCRLRPISGGPT